MPVIGCDTYIVKPGDTLYSIGKKYSINWRILAKINDLDTPDLIKPGQEISVPGTWWTGTCDDMEKIFDWTGYVSNRVSLLNMFSLAAKGELAEAEDEGNRIILDNGIFIAALAILKNPAAAQFVQVCISLGIDSLLELKNGSK